MSQTRLIVKYALRYPFLVLVTTALGFSGALFNGIGTALVIPLVLAFLGQELNFRGTPPVLEKAFSVFDMFGEQYRLPAMTAAIVLAIVLKNATGYANAIASGHLSRCLVKEIRKEALLLLLDLDIDYYARHRIGDVLNQIGNEVLRTAASIRTGLSTINIFFTILVFLGALLSISFQLTVATTAIALLVALTLQGFVRRSKRYGQMLSDSSRDYSIALQEVLNGVRLVKASGNEEKEYHRLVELMEARERADFKCQANTALIGPFNEVSGVVTIISIVILGQTFLAGQMETLAASLLNYLVLLFRLLPFIGQLNGARTQFANNAASVEVVTKFLDRADKPIMPSGALSLTALKEGIRFEDISFCYPGHDKIVLDGVDLWLPQGTTLALVGGSGSGKSTLADLMARFYDPTAGRITLDGRDLREYDLRSLRRRMGIVSQDTYLFNDSVRNNIAYARPDATDREIQEAAKRANAYEFIVQLSDGFDTLIGDRGVLLSGGQRQRLAIARALLSDPDILILDEATSALDTVSERLVQQAIDELSRDRTTLVIAHRLSTVQSADQIAVLDRGRVMEVGTHSELLRKNGHYMRLYAMQFSEDAQDLTRIAKNETMMNISYEVRTRLTPTIGFLNLLVDDLVDTPEERKETMEGAYDAAIRLLRTLEFLENSARVEMEKSPTTKTSSATNP